MRDEFPEVKKGNVYTVELTALSNWMWEKRVGKKDDYSNYYTGLGFLGE